MKSSRVISLIVRYVTVFTFSNKIGEMKKNNVNLSLNVNNYCIAEMLRCKIKN